MIEYPIAIQHDYPGVIAVPFRIHKATHNDLETIVEFNMQMAGETEGKKLSRETLSAGVAALFEVPSRGFYLLADKDGVAAGGLLITTEWSDWRNAYFWWIQSVYVRPEYRRQGVYAGLHRHVAVAARADGRVCGIRLYVDQGNEPAKKVYERLGMMPARYEFYEQSIPVRDKR
jgi:GNAT superfamily N-acetyltransferase